MVTKSRQGWTELAWRWVVQAFMVSVKVSFDATFLWMVLVHMFAVTVVAAESVHLGKNTAYHEKQKEK